MYQLARTGKVKWVSVIADGPVMRTQWGVADGASAQMVEKVCQGTNQGKENYRNPVQQAVFETDAKLGKKMKEGYLPWEEFQEELESDGEPVLLSEMPKSFFPCKPISNTPKGVLEGASTYGQRKHNGHCVLLSVDENGVERVYSRRMEDITASLSSLGIFRNMFGLVPKHSLLLCELVYVPDGTGVESPREVAKVVRVKEPAKAARRYKEGNLKGEYSLKPFDALWWEGEFLGGCTHLRRDAIISEYGIETPVIFPSWRAKEAEARAEGWEGFVLRTPDERSNISFSVDGKAHRAGSWKFKFVKETDVVALSATKGKSGRHASVYARFKLAQYTPSGELREYGFCGTGVLSHDYLKKLTSDLDSGRVSWPLVVEVEYSSRQEGSHCFEFPIIQRVRWDKAPEECVYEPEEES